MGLFTLMLDSNLNIKTSERIAKLEATVSDIKADYVSKDKLEAEIVKAKYEGMKAGIKAGITVASVIFAGISCLAAVIALF